MNKPKIAVVGEYKESFKPHTDLNKCLEVMKEKHKFEYEWIGTKEVFEEKNNLLSRYSGIWSAPGSPFESLEGAIYAIQYARENNIPHLGTCAGFQHTVIEYARNVLGIKEAQHEEYDSQASILFVSKLTCSLAGKSMTVFLKEETLARQCYDKKAVTEDYYCNFGINPEFADQIERESMVVSGIDQDNEIRIIENTNHRFFIATLFVPQSRFVRDGEHPIISKFIECCLCPLRFGES